MEDEISLVSCSLPTPSLPPSLPPSVQWQSLKSGRIMRRVVVVAEAAAALINKADLTGLQIKLPHFVAITRDTIWVFILGLGYDISSFSTTIT